MFLSQQDGVASDELSATTTRAFVRFTSLFGFRPRNAQALHAVIREFAHFFTHFVLAMFAGFAFMTSLRRLRPALGWSSTVSTVAAIFDELSQFLSDGRGVELLDLGLNLLGVALGTLFIWFFIKIIRSISTSKSNRNT